MLFTLSTCPRAPSGAAAFAGTGERVYMAFAILIGLASGPLQSASRSLLARMAPPEHMSEFFGFFAFSGKVTAFAAPFVVAWCPAPPAACKPPCRRSWRSCWRGWWEWCS